MTTQHERDLAAGEIIYVVAAHVLGEKLPEGATRLTLLDISVEDRDEAERLVRPMISAVDQTKKDWAFDAIGRGFTSILSGVLGGLGGVKEIGLGLKSVSNGTHPPRATAQETHLLYLDMLAGRPLSLNGRSLSRHNFGKDVV
jgi:hypothetical protein